MDFCLDEPHPFGQQIQIVAAALLHREYIASHVSYSASTPARMNEIAKYSRCN
jgi:hypothetical protein